MAYRKQKFKDGEYLTAKHLNHIEDGIVALEETLESYDISTGGDNLLDFANLVAVGYSSDYPVTFDTENETIIMTEGGYESNSGLLTICPSLVEGKKYTLSYSCSAEYHYGYVNHIIFTDSFTFVATSAVLNSTLSFHAFYDEECLYSAYGAVISDIKIVEESSSGGSGEDGATFIPSVSTDGVISWTNDKGLPNPDPVDIKGEDGVGIAKIELYNTVAGGTIDIYRITYTDPDRAHTDFEVHHGTKGDPGKDGTSPTVAVSKSGKVTTITITDKNGTKTATVNDGADGSSVSVSSVNESTASGADNEVHFSDGSMLVVRNGKDGDDYVLTAADKQEIKNAIISSIITQEAGQSERLVMSQKTVTDLVEDALGSGGSTLYETVDSVAKMTDTSKKYVLSTTGTIWENRTETITKTVPNFTNLIKFDADGNPTNVTLNKRLNSSGSTSGSDGSFVIEDRYPFKPNSRQKVYINRKPQGQSKATHYEGIDTTAVFGEGNTTITEYTPEDGYYSMYLFPNAPSVGYFKFSSQILTTSITKDDIKGLIVTHEEPITYTEKEETVSDWYDTGLQPSTSGGNGNYVSLLVKVNENASAIDEVSKRVTVIETGSETLTIPSFWKDAVDACISKIKALQVGRNCVTFPFFSDNHQRNGYAGMLIGHVMKECHIPYAFYGGDSISSGYIESEAVMIEQDKAFDTAMSYIPNGRFCRAVGNHDGYWAVDANERHEYTDAQNYELFLREESIAQNKHFGGDGTYYYVDDIASKVRWIVLDTNDGAVESEQISWLQNTALSFTESGWAVVFISHQPISNHYHANISNAAEVRTVVKNYINGSAANKAAVVGWYSGHIHRDRIYTGVATNTEDDSQGTAMGFTQVTITSDHTSIVYEDATKHAVANDDLSHAIDFVTINKATRKVNLTRLGIGADRSYTY